MAKHLIFYEVNEAESSMTLFTHFPMSTPDDTTKHAREVFDAINNQGAITIRGLRKEFPDLSVMKLSQALNALRNHNLITRRTLTAHDED